METYLVFLNKFSIWMLNGKRTARKRIEDVLINALDENTMRETTANDTLIAAALEMMEI